MLKKDLGLGAIIGAAVGLLVQPILTNVLVNLDPGPGNVRALVWTDPWDLMPYRVGLFFILLAAGLLGIFIGYQLGKIRPFIYQFTKFAAVGTLNTLINLGALNLLITLTGIASGYKYSLFVLVGFLLATTNSFLWNKLWTFGDTTGGGTKQALAFYALTAVGAILNVGIASFIVNGVAHPDISPALWANVGGLAGVLASFLWNFLGYKFFIFKKPAVPPAQAL